MPAPELEAALRARGMKATGSTQQMRDRLTQWLELSIVHNLPVSLLILSRAFLITQKETVQEALKETIATLPEDVVEEVQISVEKVEVEERLEVVKRQKELMHEEKAKKEKKEEKKKEPAPAKPEEKMQEKIAELGAAVSILAQPSAVAKERMELLGLKAEREQHKAEMQAAEKIDSAELKEKELEKESLKLEKERKEREERERKQREEEAARLLEAQARKEKEKEPVEEAEEEEEKEGKEIKLGTRKTKRLEQKLDRMIKDLEKEVEKVEKRVGSKLHLIFPS